MMLFPIVLAFLHGAFLQCPYTAILLVVTVLLWSARTHCSYVVFLHTALTNCNYIRIVIVVLHSVLTQDSDDIESAPALYYEVLSSGVRTECSSLEFLHSPLALGTCIVLLNAFAYSACILTPCFFAVSLHSDTACGDSAFPECSYTVLLRSALSQCSYIL